MNECLLSLDISTSCTGFCIFDIETKKLIHYDAWEMKNDKKFPNLYYKANFVSQQIEELFQKYPIKHIFIEPALFAFKPGFSSAQTISTLVKFNGMVSYFIWKTSNIEPKYISARSARKTYGITIPKKTDPKKIVMEYVLRNEQDFKVELTNRGNPKPYFFDIADALVIGRSALLTEF